MAENYEGKISSLQVQIVGDEEEQRRCHLVNYIFYTGKLCEAKGRIKEDSQVFKDMVSEIHESQEEWQMLEKQLLDGIENYLNAKKFDFDGMDTCVGTLKYLDRVYSYGKDLKYLQHKKLQTLLKNANKFSKQMVENYYNENNLDESLEDKK